MNGRIHTMARGEIGRGMILIEGTKIKALGTKIDAPADAEILDVNGLDIFPGFVAANTRLGLANDLNGDSEILFSPFFRAVDSLSPYKEIYGVDDIVSSGVTTVYTAPKLYTWKAVAGMGCVFKLSNKFIPLRILSPSAGMQMDLSYSEIKRMRTERLNAPRTQMGIVASLRKYLQEAQNYLKSREAYEKATPGAGTPPRDFELEPLVKVLRKEISARIECESESEIRAALDIAQEFGIRVVLERSMEAYKFADELKRNNIACVVGPIREGWGSTLAERFNTFRNPGWLVQAGVKIAIQAENFGNLLTYPRTLVIEAAQAVRYGLAPEEALRAITINAAEILGVEKRVGSLEIGKDADLAIFNGHPFELRSRAKMVIIDGEIVYRESLGK